jgi:hypothetical protein
MWLCPVIVLQTSNAMERLSIAFANKVLKDQKARDYYSQMGSFLEV